VKGLGDAVGAAEEAQRESAKLAKTLQNAGDASGEWDKNAEHLATTLQYQVGVSDEVIKGAQTILATFKPLASTAGKTGGAFDRATKAAIDLSKAGFGDVTSASKQLLKALSNPEKGLGGLAKAGIQFSDAQKKVITRLVESGDSATAYSVILDTV